jgi:hypothetical protein
MKKYLVLFASLFVTVLLVPSTAQASRCSIGDNGISYNLDDEPARFANLSTQRGMNCSSARYVLNKWLRKAYEEQYSNQIPTDFWDGYVDWHCYKLSRLRWQCREYDSGTRFKFTAYRYW